MNTLWQTIRLGSACEKIGSGATPRGGSEVYQATGISLIRSQNIYNDGFKRDGLAFIGDKHARELENVNVQSGDVLLNITGDSVARVCQVPDKILPARVNQHVAIIRPKKNVLDARFLHYFLIHPQTQAHMLGLAGAGATRNALTKGMIESFEIKAPSFSEQRTIAAVLGSLDDKIELNRRMNETLEALAQSLFKSWFVDFDPYLHTVGVMPNQIPKGWRETVLLECCENIFSGGTPSTQSPDYWGGDIPWLSSGETRGRFIIDTEKTITPLGVANSSTRQARAGSTVIASAGQGHTRGQTSFLTFDSYINQSVVVLVADKKISSDLFLFFDLARRYEQFRQMSDSQSSRGSLTTKLLAEMKVVVPPRELISKFDETVAPMTKKIVANLHESRTLAALRDALLPKLLSGELRVPKNEKEVLS